ncbi:MAG: RNA polymerase sigma factor [Candidatus Zhuqueibacterota bacterium]
MTIESDRQLMLEFQSGDETAFLELHQRIKTGLWLYCLKMIGDEEVAADLFQDIITKLITKKHLFNGKGSAFGWIFKIARNHILNVKTRTQFHLSIESIEAISTENYDIHFENKEHFKLVIAYIEKLPDDLKDAILLHDINDLSYDEIADIMDISVDAIRMRVYRARKQLRTWLMPIIYPE